MIGHFLSVHALIKVEAGEGQIDLERLNFEWIKEMRQSGELPIAVNRMKDGWIVFTDSTEAMQSFLEKITDNEDAFDTDDPVLWKRVT